MVADNPNLKIPNPFETPEDGFLTPEAQTKQLWCDVYVNFVNESSSRARKEADKAVMCYKERFQ